MPVHSKKVFSDTLYSMLKSTPLHKISVTGLCEASNFSRKTFYNNFTDIYDLFTYTQISFMEELVNCFLTNKDFYASFCSSLYMIKEHRSLFINAVNEYENNIYYQSYATYHINLCIAYMEKQDQAPIDNESKLLLTIYWYGVSQILSTWLKKGTNESPEYLAAVFTEAMPDKLKKYYF